MTGQVFLCAVPLGPGLLLYPGICLFYALSPFLSSFPFFIAPFLSGFPNPKIKVRCLCSCPPCIPRYGRLCPINGSLLHTASCRSFDPSKQPVFRYMGILPACCSGTFRLLSVSFLSGPTASWANGDTSCLCRPSYLRHVTGRKSPLFVCPADCLFYPPKPSSLLSYTFYTGLTVYSRSICDYCLLSFLACHRIGFIGCECRLSRLILPF